MSCAEIKSLVSHHNTSSTKGDHSRLINVGSDAHGDTNVKQEERVLIDCIAELPACSFVCRRARLQRIGKGEKSGREVSKDLVETNSVLVMS